VEAVDEQRDVVIHLEVGVAPELGRPDAADIRIVGMDPHVQRVLIAEQLDHGPFGTRFTLLRLPLAKLRNGIGRNPDRFGQSPVEADRSRDHRCPKRALLSRADCPGQEHP